ncbi:MAG: hypothetical protein V4692_01325 [Bdellovibrionota bacterium]
MLKSLLVCSFLLLSVSAQAADLKCADKATEFATKKNFKRFGASTHNCGTKLLASGEFLETYLVCVSDETDPSEWVVVVEKEGKNALGKLIDCKIKFADVQYDSQTPTFDDEAGNLETLECSGDQGGKPAFTCEKKK